MAKKEIRTKYIKSLVADKDAMAKVLEESTKESLSSLLDESVNRSLRQMLAESDDDSYEEEADTDQPEFDMGDQNADANGDIDVNLESGEGDANCENGECEPDADGNEVWDSINDCMDSDGEYDLRGKDISSVIEILKTIEKMAPDTDVRIIKNSDDTIDVEGGEGETGDDMMGGGENAEPNNFEQEMGSEGQIDGNDGMDNNVDMNAADGAEGGDQDDDFEFELELGDDETPEETPEDGMVNEGNVNLGYTDNYQNKSAMTMPNDKGEGEGDSRFDGGAPDGGENNKKRWVGTKGKDNGNPYSEKTKQPMTEEADECNNECNEENIFEVELDEVHTTTENNGLVNATGIVNTNSNGEGEKKARNSRSGAAQVRGTGDGRMTNESRIATIERQYNAMLNENKELKAIATQIKKQLNEAVLINASLAKVIKLITENATSRDEKINILNRFNRVQSLNECKNLYVQISNELKNAHSVNNNLLNKQLTEAKGQNKNMIVETNMLNQSEDLKQILDLNERLMRMEKKPIIK